MRRSFVRFASAFALLGALVSPVAASKSPTEIATEIDTSLADNKQGLITEALLRTVLKDIAAAQTSLYYLVTTCATNQWVSGFASTGAPNCTRPAFSNISGSIQPGQMIAPGVGTLGGVYSSSAGSNQFATGIDVTGTVTYAQPSFSNLSGTIAAAQLIAPGASTFGAVKSSSAPTNQFATGINTSGVVTYAQPAIANISGASKYADGTTGTGVNATANSFSASNQALFLSGTLTNTGTAPYALLSLTDTAASSGFLTGLWVAHNIGASAGEGSRAGFQSILTINNPLTDVSNRGLYYIASFPQTYVGANLGGASGAGNQRGDVYGAGALVQVGSGATFLNSVTGQETNVSVQAGASTKHKMIQTIIAVNSDAVGGSDFNAMTAYLTDATATYKWPLGVSFGSPLGLWPFDTSSTIIGSTAPSSGSRVANYGIDFSGVTFSTAFLKSTGFLVGPSGALTASTISSTGAVAGVVVGPRSGSGNSYQWYNPSGAGLKLTDGGSDLISLTSTGAIYAGGEIAPVNTVVGSLGTCNSTTRGALKVVTDGAAGLAWGATQTGGASAVYLSFCNGAAWTVAAK